MGQSAKGISIKFKLTLLMTGMVVLMFGATGFLLVNLIREKNSENNIRYLESISAQYANRAKNFLEEPLFSTRSLALTLSDFESIPVEARRRVYIGMTKRLLDENEKWVGVWIQWEPGLLDGLDARYRNDIRGGAGTETGRFAPYWTRGSQGIKMEASLDKHYLEDYYVRPKSLLHEIVTEPYIDTPQGTEVLMVSAAAPIISSEGRFLGVVGIDISLDSLQADLGRLELYTDAPKDQRGFGRLISPLGTVCTHPDASRIGKTAPEWTGEEAESIRISLTNGNQFTQESYSVSTGVTMMKSFVPFKLGQEEQAWMFGTVVPLETFYKDSADVMMRGIIILLTGLLLMLATVFVAVSRMLKPIGLARDALRDIAEGEGDLTRSLAVTDRDEVGELANYFNVFAKNLASIINQTRNQVRSLTKVGAELEDNMERVGSAIEEIGATLNDMSRRSSNQTSSIMEVSSTVEEIVGNLASLNRQIENQNDTLASSASAVEEMVANIQSITKNVDLSMGSFTRLRTVSDEGFERLEEVNEVIRKISDQSDGLQEANSIINNIASQTNLLAMNAAIEAAHAGEAGKGFAVVADEIRKLAEESAGRSREISNLLKSLHSLSDTAVDSAGAAGTAFESIRSSVEEVTNRQQEIRAAVEQQSSGNKVVLDGVHHLKQISTEVGSGSKEISLGSQNILKLVLGVVETTRALQTAIDEITRANSEINSSTLATRELSRRNRGIIDTLDGLVARFKT